MKFVGWEIVFGRKLKTATVERIRKVSFFQILKKRQNKRTSELLMANRFFESLRFFTGKWKRSNAYTGKVITRNDQNKLFSIGSKPVSSPRHVLLKHRSSPLFIVKILFAEVCGVFVCHMHYDFPSPPPISTNGSNSNRLKGFCTQVIWTRFSCNNFRWRSKVIVLNGLKKKKNTRI